MALDGLMINKIVLDLNKYIPMRINKIYGVSNSELLFHVRTNKENKILLINTEASSNRIHFTSRDYINEEHPNNFVMLLRKHFTNGQIIEIKQKDYDRFICIKIENRNAIGDIVYFNIYLELLGRYSNMIVCDENNIILDATKRISPFENPNTVIVPGAKYTLFGAQNKLNPFKTDKFDINESLVKQFSGFSPTLEKEFRHRIKNNQTFKSIINEIETSNSLIISNKGRRSDFHAIELLHQNATYKSFPLHKGFDQLYFDVDQKQRIANETKDLAKFISREIKKQKRKLIKLEEQFVNNQNAAINLKYGDLIITYQNKIKKGMKYTNLIDYETNEEITIDLDEKLDAIANAQKYYKIYRKQSNSIKHLTTQIEETKNDIDYFTLLSEQLDYADINSAREIRQELVDNKYLFEKTKRKNTKKTKSPKFLNIVYDENTTIRVGRNNVQNNYVTFKASHRNDYWFHIQDYHGAHVVVSTNELTNDIISLCASFAAYYSKARDSKNIPVNYTQVKNIKKIPKAALGMVSISNYQTVYIDVNKEIVENYIN